MRLAVICATFVMCSTFFCFWDPMGLRLQEIIQLKESAMKIQYNTDKTISGSEKRAEEFEALLADELRTYSSHITRIELHLSDENGIKEGYNDIRCLLEARIEGKPPIAVTFTADNVDLAIAGAIDKLKASLESIIERMTDHHK
jgi:hypothetical protein